MDKDFTALVQMFHIQGCIVLGKVKNPVTDKFEVNRDQAKMYIDILAMLQRKTKDNLTDDEEKMLDKALQELQMYFVQSNQ